MLRTALSIRGRTKKATRKQSAGATRSHGGAVRPFVRARRSTER
jgi:hypothetical protein